jgi:hypothetical protein
LLARHPAMHELPAFAPRPRPMCLAIGQAFTSMSDEFYNDCTIRSSIARWPMRPLHAILALIPIIYLNDLSDPSKPLQKSCAVGQSGCGLSR